MFTNLIDAINDIYDSAYETEDVRIYMDAVDELFTIHKDIKATQFMQCNILGHTDCAIGLDDDLCALEGELDKVATEALRLSRLLEACANELEAEQMHDRGRFDYMNSRI